MRYLILILYLLGLSFSNIFAQETSESITREKELKLFIDTSLNNETEYFQIYYNRNYSLEAELVSNSADSILLRILDFYRFSKKKKKSFFKSFRIKKRILKYIPWGYHKPSLLIGYPFKEIPGESRSGGWYNHKNKRIVITTNNSKYKSIIMTLTHEINHAVYNYNPSWRKKPVFGYELGVGIVIEDYKNEIDFRSRSINEGTSDLLENLLDEDNRFNLSILNNLLPDISKLQLTMNDSVAKTIMDLSEIHKGENWTHETYLYSKSFVLFLIDQFGIDKYRDFLKVRTVDKMFVTEAFNKTYSIDYFKFENDWLQWAYGINQVQIDLLVNEERPK
tara:strand:+ start:13038 stop:14042 length:1005 start_codon:yes stop_codon:yes gene_type:complete